MKFVGTNDGKIFEKATFAMNGTIRIGGVGLEKLYYPKDIIKEADTIEELCDEFIEVHKTLKNGIFEQPYFDVVSEQVRNGSPVGNLYGAIWTDKGLIYVAKMNEKGELELI